MQATITQTRRRTDWWQGAREFAARHPALCTLLLTAIVGLGHAIWIWKHRMVGTFDPDEAGYLADAFGFKRMLWTDGPAGLMEEIGRTGTAPLVPLVSAAWLFVGPDDPRWAMLVQPGFMVLAATSITATSRRLVGPGTAIAAGLAFVSFPTVILATQDYNYGLAPTAFLGVALWALMASDRCTNRWVFVVGPAVAAMLLSRTMTIAFLPGVLLAGVICAGRRPRALARFGLSMLIAVAIAAPWYIAQQAEIFGYLTAYGYGDRTGYFEDSTIWSRLLERPLTLFASTGIWAGLALLTSTAWVLVRHRKHLLSRSRRYLESSDRAMLFVVLVSGFAALLSTRNVGSWFDLPLVVPLMPLGAEIISATATWFRRAVLVVGSAMGAFSLLTSWWIIPYGVLVPFASGYEYALSDVDASFGPQHRDTISVLAEHWRLSHSEIARYLMDRDAQTGVVVEVTGNTLLFNNNNLELASEIEGNDLDTRVPDTLGSEQDRAEHLAPMAYDDQGRLVKRLIVATDSRRNLFIPDMHKDEFLVEAHDRGWVPIRRFTLPNGHRVEILRPPDSQDPG